MLIADAFAGAAEDLPLRHWASNALDGGTGNDRLLATAFADPSQGSDAFATNRLFGRAGNDTLQATITEGGIGRSLLYGGDNYDTLRAYGGQDNVLSGGGGRDRIYTGDGDETLSGGSHIDTFFFRFGAQLGTKVITDFERNSDRLSFGYISADWVDSGSTVVDQGVGRDVVVSFDAGGTTLVFEDIGTGGIDSILDLVANPDDQFSFLDEQGVSANPLPCACRAYRKVAGDEAGAPGSPRRRRFGH